MAASIDQTLAELHAELEQIEKQLVGMNILHMRRMMLKDGIDVLEKLKQQESQNITQRPVWEVARDVLSAANQPMTVGELLLRLTGMGIKFSGETPLESLRTALIRKPDVFSRAKGGQFDLKSREVDHPSPKAESARKPWTYKK
jgi:hypothetical protein